MANVSMTLPYLFLTIAFPFFKAKTHLDRPFVIFKNRPSTLLATGVVLLVVTKLRSLLATFFKCIKNMLKTKDGNSMSWKLLTTVLVVSKRLLSWYLVNLFTLS